MEQEIEVIKNKIKQEVLLSVEEKEALRDSLVSYMYSHPVLPKEVSRIQSNNFSSLTMLFRFALVAIVLFGVGGGSMALAEKAVPGDALYGVKTQINEPIVALFVSGDKEQGLYAVRLASRRLEEAEALAVKQSLSEDKKSLLEQKLLAQTSVAHEKISALQNTDVSAAVNVSASLETAMRSHEEILATITKNERNDSSTVSDLAQTVSSETFTATNLRIDAETSAVSVAIATPVTQQDILALKAELRDLEGRFGDKVALSPLKEYVQQAKSLIAESSNDVSVNKKEEALKKLDQADALVKQIAVIAQSPVTATTASVQTNTTMVPVSTLMAPPPTVYTAGAPKATATSTYTAPKSNQ